MTTRGQLAEAVSSVDGYVGYAERPTAPQPGDAWPLLGAYERGRGLSFARVWRVIVALDPDEAAAIAQLDRDLETLAVAITPLAHVVSARPVTIPTEAGTLNGAEITARSE